MSTDYASGLTLYRMANKFYELGQPAHAAQMLQLAHQDLVGALSDTALTVQVRRRLGDTDLKLAELYLAKGRMRAALKLSEAAVKNYTLALENIARKKDRRYAPGILQNRGLAHYRLGSYTQALKDWKQLSKERRKSLEGLIREAERKAHGNV
jgi:tetratricopeptide (TPR) repeat protein